MANMHMTDNAPMKLEKHYTCWIGWHIPNKSPFPRLAIGLLVYVMPSKPGMCLLYLDTNIDNADKVCRKKGYPDTIASLRIGDLLGICHLLSIQQV